VSETGAVRPVGDARVLPEQAARVAEWLRERVRAVTPPVQLALLPGGRSNLTYRVTDAAGRTWVLRRPPLVGVVQSAHNVLREHRVMASLASTAVPVPVMIGACEDLDLLGTPFVVMADVEGLVPASRGAVERELSPAIRGVMAESLLEALVQLHAVVPSDVGLADLAAGEGHVLRQLRRFDGQLDQYGIPSDDHIRELGRRLRAAIPEQTETAIVHGDYRPGNVIVGPGGAVCAVLDWELCTLGDPRVDVGWLLAYWGHDGAGASDLPFDVPTRAVGFPPSERVSERYHQLSGRAEDDMGYFVAFALWRLAAILIGVQARESLSAYGRPARDSPLAGKIDRVVGMAGAAATAAGR
jgi:aminoglycoside phosphotransferase (APT) family kinase protein